ncbi:hypothetical protein IFR04_000635 [Cadophora malorum]|uniref:SGNH hydrolase-type esterase domain-containing protein n=1 Tax=Cadophora malorum TaxID=108018 RepID=A0A8H7WK05_9HELO|nr:hypothetical protein IFR04_000635 [Cadophora malorum]
MHHCQLTYLLLLGFSTATSTHLLPKRNFLDATNATSRRWNIDYDGPRGNWVGMGDSFSAGPGAGNQIDGPCKRNDKGYPAILQDDWPNGDAHTLKFISCSGAKIPDTMEKQLPQIDSSLKYATLSISGNDIGFSKILQSCIAGIPLTRNCDTLLAEARTKLYSQELYDGYPEVVDGVLSRSGWQADGANRVMIYQTAYPAFFDALTPQCNSISFNPLIDGSPLLTSALREKMNSIQAELNTMIAFWIANVNVKYSDTFSPIIYVDQDEDYTQHRFCNKDTTEPVFNNPNCWFFPIRGAGNPPTVSDYDAVDPGTCEAAAGDDFRALWICGMVRQKQIDPDFDLTQTVPFEWIAKIFHPTIPGHTAVAKAVKSAMAFELYRSGVQNLKILAAGDSITFGYRSSDGNGGYRRTLDNLLTESVYNIEWYGTQNAGGRLRHEGYSGYKIQELEQRLLQSGSLTNDLNLVLLMVGTNDINEGAAPATAAAYLSQMIQTIHSRAPDAMIHIGNLIPMGASKTPIFPLESKQRAVMEYNSYIRELVNQGRTDGLRIAVVHSSVDQYSRADDLHPNDRGYEKMGHDWFEAIQRVNQKGLIKDAPFAADQACATNPVWYPQGEIANGAGLGKDLQANVNCGDIPDTPGKCSCGTGIDTSEPGDYEVTLTGGSCTDMSYENIQAVHFADLDGDGRAEYLWVDAKGAVRAFYNQGSASPPQSQDGSKVSWWDAGTIATGVGARRQEVHFADINGDGRHDYIWVHPEGSIEVWINQGQVAGGKTPANVGWWPQGIVATGTGSPGSRIKFADLNGDGKADYLIIDDIGGVDVYLNLGPKANTDPNGGQVEWWPQKKTATGVGGNRLQTNFGDMNGDGRDDYLWLQDSGAVRLWQNGGSAGNPGERIWIERGEIMTGDGTPGYQILFADLNGDGRVEYLKVDPNTSAVSAYQNACHS